MSFLPWSTAIHPTRPLVDSSRMLRIYNMRMRRSPRSSYLVLVYVLGYLHLCVNVN